MAYMGNYAPSMFGGDMVNAGPTIGSGAIPRAPTTTNSMTGDVATMAGGGSSPAVGSYSATGGAGYTQVRNPYYDPRSPGVNKQSMIFKYTGAPATSAPGGSNPFSVSPTATPSAPIGFGQSPYYAGLQNAANTAGVASGVQGAANIGQAAELRGGASAVMNTAFDPQQALYDRTAQRLQDQIRVGQAARGTTMSPYGAGGEAQGMSNFNIDWQNQQLNRQTQGLGAAGTAGTQAGNVGQMGVGQTQQAGQLPYGAYDTQRQSNIQDWITFMNQKNIESGLAQQNYPNQLAQQSMTNAGGVPYISPPRGMY